MDTLKVDNEMSKWVAETIDSKPDDYFMNALLGMCVLPEQENARFCFGYYRNINSKERFVFEHAWIEYNGVIIDPTLVLKKYRLENYIYFSVGDFELEEISDFYFYNIQNSEDFENELDCHSVCMTLEKAEEYYLGMERIKALNYIELLSY